MLSEELARFAREVSSLDDAIELSEATVKDLKARREKILTDDIPAILATYGLQSAKLVDGRNVKIEEIFTVKSAGMDRAALVAWLEANEMGDIVEDVISFARGNVDGTLIELLDSGRYNFTRESDVNAKRLQAAIKRHVEAGGDLPPDTACEVNIFQRAKIK